MGARKSGAGVGNQACAPILVSQERRREGNLPTCYRWRGAGLGLAVGCAIEVADACRRMVLWSAESSGAGCPEPGEYGESVSTGDQRTRWAGVDCACLSGLVIFAVQAVAALARKPAT